MLDQLCVVKRNGLDAAELAGEERLVGPGGSDRLGPGNGYGSPFMAVARSAGLLLDGKQVQRVLCRGRALPGDPFGGAPVIVLACAHSGADRLRSLLETHPDLACTSGTGLLRLCEQAVAAWRKADGRAAGPPSGPAVTATRALAASFITCVLRPEGKRRWCEVAVPDAEAAETFLRLYPGARIICLHRACAGVVLAALNAGSRRLAHAVAEPFTEACPGSSVAALTSDWVARTGSLLAFERAHPKSCLRVRFEDLTAAPRQTAERITSFLGIVGFECPPAPAEETPLRSDSIGPETGVPVDLIPPASLARADDLLRQVGYPPLTAGSPGSW
jgi:Sulfotransferase family